MKTKYKRKAYYKVIDSMNEYKIPILVGLRRTGKTTILQQIREKYKDVQIINCDDFDILSRTPLSFMGYIKNIVDNGTKIILFDEIQVFEKWDKIVKNIFDKFVAFKKIKVVVTGSSSLSFKSRDTGIDRTEKIFINTLDYQEYLSLSNKDDSYETFEHFLTYGAFPQYVHNEQTISKLLNSLVTPIIRDDIPNAYSVNTWNMIVFLNELKTLTNGEFNKLRSSKNTGIKIDQINTYLNVLEKTMIIKIVKRIDKGGRFLRYPKFKVYINPHFHIWLLNKEFKNLDNQIKGHIIESYWLFWATQLNGYYKEFYYYKDDKGNEIDFVTLDPLNREGFKTIHELKYRNEIDRSIEVKLKNILAKTRILWCKENGKSEDGLVKYLSIKDGSDNK